MFSSLKCFCKWRQINLQPSEKVETNSLTAHNSKLLFLAPGTFQPLQTVMKTFFMMKYFSLFQAQCSPAPVILSFMTLTDECKHPWPVPCGCLLQWLHNDVIETCFTTVIKWSRSKVRRTLDDSIKEDVKTFVRELSVHAWEFGSMIDNCFVHYCLMSFNISGLYHCVMFCSVLRELTKNKSIKANLIERFPNGKKL